MKISSNSIGVVLLASAALLCGKPLTAQSSPGCTAGGYRVVAHHWDVALRIAWELRQDCAHPERPARLGAASAAAPLTAPGQRAITSPVSMAQLKPLLIRAGDAVRLWQQGPTVRIEITGTAEQSAHEGEPVIVRIARPIDDSGFNVQRISGTARAADDVEMEQ